MNQAKNLKIDMILAPIKISMCTDPSISSIENKLFPEDLFLAFQLISRELNVHSKDLRLFISHEFKEILKTSFNKLELNELDYNRGIIYFNIDLNQQSSDGLLAVKQMNYTVLLS